MPLFGDSLRSTVAALVIAAIVVAGLVLGKDLLVPLALAGCLSFILAPIVAWLTRFRVPRGAAVVTVVTIFVALLIMVSTIFANQIVSLTADLGTYRENLIGKVRAMSQSAQPDGILKRASETLDRIGHDIAIELSGPKGPNWTVEMPSGPASAPTSTTSRPQEVVVKQDDSTRWRGYAKEVMGPVAAVGLTLLFTLFILLQSRDLRDRLVRVAGTSNFSGATDALGDAAEKLSRLFLAQATVNALFGIGVGVALWMIGVPNSLLWGALAGLMRFVPFVGGLIAAIPPILLAAAVDPGWGMALTVIAIFAIGEPLMGHVVEPLILGPQAGLTPFAMLTAAGFWALIWGPIGLILAAPLTMILVVLGRYVQGLEFMTVLLGDQPALSQPEALYQRLLAEDDAGALEVIHDGSDDRKLEELFDAVVLPALRLAADDHDRGQLTREKSMAIAATMEEVVEGIDFETLGGAASRADEDRSVAVVPARNAFDRAAVKFVGEVLAQIDGVQTASVSTSTGLAALSALASSREQHPRQIVLVSVGGRDSQFLPTLVRRANKLFPDSVLIVFEPEGLQDRRATNIKASTPEVRRCRRLQSVIEQVRDTVTVTAGAATA